MARCLRRNAGPRPRRCGAPPERVWPSGRAPAAARRPKRSFFRPPEPARLGLLAPVAQLDRASASGAEGYRFDPCREYLQFRRTKPRFLGRLLHFVAAGPNIDSAGPEKAKGPAPSTLPVRTLSSRLKATVTTISHLALDSFPGVLNGGGTASDCEPTTVSNNSTKEIKRRTRVATLFPNEASLLRLASAVLSEISDDWETERAYLTMEAR